MSPRLPVISGREAVRAFERLGYQVVRQRGSHLRLRHPTDPSRQPLTIPDHATLKPGLLRRLIRDAQLDYRTLPLLDRAPSPAHDDRRTSSR